jgi:ESS family glutamate:Na+ symporter
MTHIALNMIQTAGLGALALIVGMAMTRRVTLIVLQNLMPQTIIRLMGTDRLLDMDRIVSVGNICLSMFLGMAMISLKLWELQTLALPLLVILLTQVLLMGVFVYWVAFPLLGRDYDAAVLCAGMCGFGLGATPNAMANMSAVCYKYRYSVKPFLIVPIIGAMFADLINTGIITLFLNVI